MALPLSGQISFNSIATEIGTIPPYSFGGMSLQAGFTSPYYISNFYGYSAGGIKGLLLFDSCFGKELGEFFLDAEDFSKATYIYTDKDLKSIYEYEGTISDNTFSRFYSPKNGLEKPILCK